MGGNIKKYTKAKGYESLSREMLQDINNLSLQSIGLLANMISMPDNWTTHKTELYNRFSKNKRTSVKNAWDELVENNYIVQFRSRNGRQYEYTYFFSQTKFSLEDIKELEKEIGCPIWDGKVKKTVESSTVENQQSKKNSSDNINSTVDFEQSKMDSPKSTDMKLTIDEINYKDLDTIDTKDTPSEKNEINKNIIMTDLERAKLKKAYMEKGFYGNTDKVPPNISRMLNAFSESTVEAENYYRIIIQAQTKIMDDYKLFWFIEHEPELEQIIINAFSRAIKKIEKERDVENKDGFIYRSIYNALEGRLAFSSVNE